MSHPASSTNLRRNVAPGLVFGAAIACGAYFRFAHLGHSPLWRDEASFAFMAVAPLGELLSILQRDVHAPLYFLLLKGWAGLFGQSEAALRSLGALFGWLCIPAAWWFARPLIGSLGAAWVALLVAVNPGSIHASTDIMVYPLLTLQTILAAGALERAWHDGRRRWWVLHALLLAASAYTHMWGLLLWASAGLAALVLIVGHVRRTRAAPPWLADYLVFNAIAVVLSAVWLARIAGQAGSRSMDHLLYTPGFLGLLTATFDYWFNSRQVVLAVVVLTIALPMLWVRSERTRTGTDERPTRGLLLALCLAFAPQIICFEISYLKAAYLQRYTIACIPFFVVLFAATLIWIRPRWLAVGLGLFVAVWPIVPLNRSFDGIRHVQRRRTPLAQLAQIVREQARDGDVIYIFPEFYASSFNWYYRGDLPQICYPALKRVETVDWHTYADRVEDPQAITRAEEHLFAHLGPAGRVWMIQNRAYRGTMGGSIDYKDTLARIMQRLRTRLRFRPDLSREYLSPDPDSPEYAGLEAATLVVLEQPPNPDRRPSPDQPPDSNP